MSIKQNKALVRRLNTEVWTEKNRDVIDELIAPDCVFHAGDRVFRGPEGYRTFFEAYVTAFPDLSIQINDLIAEGDSVVMSYTARGQHSGALMNVEPTGKQVELGGMSISRFKNGQMIEGNTLWNEMSLMQQLGVIPESVTRTTA